MTLLPETKNLSPKAAATRRRQSKLEIIKILPDVPMPYSVKISKQLKAAHPNLPVQHINYALHHITNGRRYLKATIEADHRHSLDGTESPLLEKHKQYAIEKLKAPAEKPIQQKPAQKPEKPDGRFGQTLSLKRKQS